MIRSFFILFIFLPFLSGLPLCKAATPGEIRGSVSDAETNEPLAGVIVRTKGAFASTDRQGRYRITIPAGADSVTFKSLGYETLTLSATANLSAVRLRQKATQLNDVIVMAPDIYAKGDTLVFNVDRFAKAEDNAIIDVLKRLPGIKIEDDGTIKYQGKPINKFYIDGNDFIGGRYGLATNNISHKDVKSVEVMERHQPVKALEGIEFPEEAGINLKLKEDARGRWVGVATAGLGAQPLLGLGSVFTMRIGPRVQNMLTVKAANTGWNPANEISDHDLDMMFSSDHSPTLWPEYICADIIATLLSEKRTRISDSWLANAITSWKSGETSMRLTLNYLGDRLDYSSSTVTDYLDSQIPSFMKQDRLHTKAHNLSAQFYTETNRRNYYLKDKLTFTLAKDQSSSAIGGSMELMQQIGRKTLSAVNDLKLIRRSEERLFSIISRNGFSHRPDRLYVAGDTESAIQSLTSTDFRSTTETQIGRMKRFWKFYLTAGLDLDYHRMNSSLSGLLPEDSHDISNTFLSNLYATPQIDYIRNGWNISLRSPLKWLHSDVERSRNYINASPRLSVRRQISSKSELFATLIYRLGSPQPYLDIDAPILSDYRNLFIGRNPGGYSHEANASLTYKYRNPLKSFFANASVSYTRSSSSFIADQLFVDDLIISTYADYLHHNSTWSANGGISKGIGRSRMVAGIDLSVFRTEATSMRDSAPVSYSQLTATFNPYIKGNLLRWLSMNYDADLGVTDLDIAHESSASLSLRQNLTLTFLPTDAVNLTVGAEHYLTRFPEGHTASLLLLDATASWRLSTRVRLSLTANNLLDSRRYRYITYSTLTRTRHDFNLRPRTILASIQFNF